MLLAWMRWTARQSGRPWPTKCLFHPVWRAAFRASSGCMPKQHGLTSSAGIQGTYAIYSWFSTSFTVPSNWTGSNVLLNFGAIDYEATLFVNGQNATFHRGGYFAFTVDVTSYLNSGANELLVFVHDPTDEDPYVIPI